jgi:hypothetical protein
VSFWPQSDVIPLPDYRGYQKAPEIE